MSDAKNAAGDHESGMEGQGGTADAEGARSIGPRITTDDDSTSSQSEGRAQVQQQVQGYQGSDWPGGPSGGAGQQSSSAAAGFGSAPAGQPPYQQPPQQPATGAAAASGSSGPSGLAGNQPSSGASARSQPRTRRARLRVSKADPWSVMKVSFLLSLALGVVTIVAVAVLWMVLDGIGVFSTVGDTMREVTQGDEGSGFDLESFLSLPRVLMFTAVIAVIDVILATALATLGSFIYNISSSFVGGVELTLAEDE